MTNRTKRSQEIAIAIEYLRTKPEYRKFVPDDIWQLTALEALIGHALDNIKARRTSRSQLMALTGVETRDIVRTDNHDDARRFAEFIRTVKAAASGIYHQRKRYQARLRQREKDEASELPVTKSGQMRLL